MASLHLKQVANRFLKPIDLKMADGALFVVVGPSGAGKTSLLRVIAGLDRHQGQILLDGRHIQKSPPHLRPMGYVSQDLHLFPHLSLEGNLQLAMTRLGWDKERRLARQTELLELLRIGHLSGRKPGTFSGGEKQRAALARALASGPRLLLLDEPFSKLDFRTARYLRGEFKSLQRELGLTTLLVTHNLEEAWFLADSLAVMGQGRLSQWDGGPLNGAAQADLAGAFLEAPNVLECQNPRPLEHGLVEADWAGCRLVVADGGRPFRRVAISPRDVELATSPPKGPDLNRFVGRIDSAEAADDSMRISCRVGEARLRVELSHRKWQESGLAPGVTAHGLMRLRHLEPL